MMAVKVVVKMTAVKMKMAVARTMVVKVLAGIMADMMAVKMNVLMAKTAVVMMLTMTVAICQQQKRMLPSRLSVQGEAPLQPQRATAYMLDWLTRPTHAKPLARNTPSPRTQ